MTNRPELEQIDHATAQLRGNRPIGGTVAAAIRTMFTEKPNPARAEFNRVARGVFLLCHEAHLLRGLLSGKPKAVHIVIPRRGNNRFGEAPIPFYCYFLGCCLIHRRNMRSADRSL